MSDQDKPVASFADVAIEAIADIMNGKNIIDGSAQSLPPGEHTFVIAVDTTQPVAPENVFLPTENPDGTWTTKIPAAHPAAGVVIGQFIDRAITPEEVAERNAEISRRLIGLGHAAAAMIQEHGIRHDDWCGSGIDVDTGKPEPCYQASKGMCGGHRLEALRAALAEALKATS